MPLADELPGATSVDDPATRRPIAGDSLRRLVAELVAVVLAFATGIMTARELGPGAKGTLSELSFLTVAGAVAAGLGLGEAGVVLLARRYRTLPQILRATLTLLVATSTVAAGLVVLIGWLQFSDRWHDLAWSIVLAGVTVPVTASMALLGALLEAQGRFNASSVGRVLMAATTTIVTWLVVVRWNRDLPGALLALLVGAGVATLLLAGALLLQGAVPRLGWDLDYSRMAIRLGFPIQLSSLVMVLTTRVDLLLVDSVSGAVVAGHYSVALTLGTLCTYGPFALSVAAYPRTAALAEDEALDFATRVCRMSVLSGAVGAIVLAPVIVVATPLAFGHGFAPSVGPALVLLLGGVLWSVQWPLCRLRAARGDGHVLLRSYTTNMVVMIAADLVLVHAFGAMGAASGSVLGAAAGAAIALRPYVDRERPASLADLLVPRRHDVRVLLNSLRSAGRAPAA